MSPFRHTSSATHLWWLLGLVMGSLLAILALRSYFDHQQEQLRTQSSNERSRLFVGDEIVRGISTIQNESNRLVLSVSLPDAGRTQRSIHRHLEKLRHDINVLQHGGTTRRTLPLNIEGQDEITITTTFQPAPGRGHLMEVIELNPLIDQIPQQLDELFAYVTRRLNCREKDDSRCIAAALEDRALLLKRNAAFYERLTENANRLFHDGHEQLKTLETQLADQHNRLIRMEIGLTLLVGLIVTSIAVLMLRNIQRAQRKLEETLSEMRLAKEAADRASRAKSDFVSRMSHELRTPLNAVIGFAELLKDEPLSPSQQNYVSLINSSGKHLLDLINAVLDHAKIEAGGLTLENITFDLAATLGAIRPIIIERANARGIDFIQRISPDLPRSLVGDPTRLRQVLINLLTNAIKFTEHGSVELQIATDGDILAFCIRDTGIGMAQAAVDNLFHPFCQADVSVTRKFGGTGLGLVISKDLITAMGGAIEVDSAPDAGSAFRFWIPLHTTNKIVTTTETSPQSDTTVIGTLVHGSVLLVDDNRVNLQLAGAMLDRLGLRYETAENGLKALDKLEKTDFALVLMDMEMPIMDGVAATREIRSREAITRTTHPMPIIAMTANALSEDRDRCFASGMNGYISKPISLASLREELFRLFGNDSVPSSPSSLFPSVSSVVFDRSTALQRLGGDEELLAELVEMFIADVPNLLGKINAAMADNDRSHLIRTTHTLKGLCATFAASPGEQAAKALEMAARDEQRTLSSCDELVCVVQKQTYALVKALTPLHAAT